MQSKLFDDMAALENEHFWFRSRKEILQVCLHRFCDCDGKSLVLDAGCGTGANVNIFEKYGKTFGIDSSSDACSYAGAKYFGKLFQGKLEKLPIKNNTFDLVALLDVLEHVETPSLVLAESFRVLKPKGKILLTVPAFMHLWSGHDLIHKHRRRYRKDKLRSDLDSAGFTTNYISYFNTHLYPMILTSRLLGRCRKAAPKSNMHRPSPLINSILYKVFRSERFWIGRFSAPVGVSLVAVVEK